MLTCAPAGSAGVGSCTEDDAFGAGGNWDCGRIIAWTGLKQVPGAGALLFFRR